MELTRSKRLAIDIDIMTMIGRSPRRTETSNTPLGAPRDHYNVSEVLDSGKTIGKLFCIDFQLTNNPNPS
jgi:hypothetical protein